MNLDTHNRVLGVPVFHAIGLACWSMFHPRDSWTPLLLWGLWIPLIWLGFSLGRAFGWSYDDLVMQVVDEALMRSQTDRAATAALVSGVSAA